MTTTLPIREIATPPAVEYALRNGAALAISISGGKDSEALANVLAAAHRANAWPGPVFLIHSDLGRAEWKETPAHVQRIADRLELPLIVTRRARGDLLDRLEERLEALKDSGKPFWPSAENRYYTSHLKSNPINSELRKPFWPSAANRYCTSDLKRGPIDGELRPYNVIVSAEGVRADESAARAKKPVVEIRKSITAFSKDPEKNLRFMEPLKALQNRRDGQRVALNWRPLRHFNEEDVWRACGTSSTDLQRRRALYKLGAKEKALEGWPCHPAYVYGNSRLSCALCILGSKPDLINGARHNPELLHTYIDMEDRGGATFKHGWSLRELLPELEAAPGA